MFKLIVAMDEERGIGVNNNIPWFIPDELQWVAKYTQKTDNSNKINALIMGKNTYFSIPAPRRPLKNRLSIVISTTLTNDDVEQGVLIFRSLLDAVDYINTCEHIEHGIFFGGVQIYQDALQQNLVDEVVETHVPGKHQATVFFPTLPDSVVFTHDESTTYNDITVIRKYYRKR